MNFKLPILIYDQDCPLCQRFKQALELMPGIGQKIQFVALSNKEVFSTFPALDPQKCQQTVHLLTEEKTILQGAEVINYLVHHAPGVGKLAWLLDTDAGKKAVNFFYEKVEEARELLKEKHTCGSCPKDHQ